MTGNTAKYDLILMGNASRQFFLFSGLTDTSNSHLYHTFNVDLSDLKDGEYTYAVLYNTRGDVSYEFKVPLLDTLVKTDEEEIILKYLQPNTGLLRVGDEILPENIYDKNNGITYYYDE